MSKQQENSNDRRILIYCKDAEEKKKLRLLAIEQGFSSPSGLLLESFRLKNI